MSARGPLAVVLALTLSLGWLGAGEPAPPQPQPPPGKSAEGKPDEPPRTEQVEETPEQRSKRLAELYDNAEALYRAGRYDEAQRLYAQIALEAPDYRRVESRLASIRTRLQDAERRQRRAQVDDLLQQAGKQIAAGNYPAAAQACEAALALDPKNRQALQRLAECEGELELHRRMFSIFEEAQASAPERQVLGRAKTAVTEPKEPSAGAPREGAAPTMRSAQDMAAGRQQVKRVVGPEQNVEVVDPPRTTPRTKAEPADAEGARLLSQAWDLYQSAKLSANPRPVLRQALDALAPISPISAHSQHTKDTAEMLRRSIARRLAEGGRVLTPEEAKQARLYQRYLQAEEHFRKQRYDEAIQVTSEILAEDHSFAMARRLNQEARQKQLEAEYQEKDLENRLTLDRRFAEIEDQSIPPDEMPRLPRPPIDLERPVYGETSPELEEKLNQRVSVNLIAADLDYFLDLLFRSTGVNIIYNPEVVEGLTITVHVSNYPLRQLLDYIARNHGLMFATTRDGVLITTPDQPRLETYIVPLRYGLVDVTLAPPWAAVDAQGGGGPAIDPPSTSNIEQLCEQFPQLTDWPQGSVYYLDRKMNVLYIRTTPEVYGKVIELLDAIDHMPLQVLIKTLFVEIKLEDFETLGLTATFTGDHGDITSDLSFKFPPEQLPGFTTPEAGMTINLAGVLDSHQLDVTLDALQRTGKARTLAAPNVICMNNCTAKISVTRTLIYVEDYEVDRADISGTTYGSPYYPFTTQPTQPQPGYPYPLSSEPIIIPVFAEGEDVGFTLDVAPSVGKDNRFIALVLNPRIREEIPPRISFEVVFPVTRYPTTVNGNGNGETQPVQQQTATVERPIIGERSVATKLTVADGATVVLGGLVQQKKIQGLSKIPLLSDIPVLGLLFQRRTYRDEKTNLIIFVQAELITPTGARYNDSGRIDEVRAAEDAARIELEEAVPPVLRPGPLP